MCFVRAAKQRGRGVVFFTSYLFCGSNVMSTRLKVMFCIEVKRPVEVTRG